MAKDLPYFKFYTGEWIGGDITILSMEAQGVFINIAAHYWNKGCSMSLANAKQRFSNNITDIEQLIFQEIIKISEDDMIVINFLDEQLNGFIEISEKRANAGRAGGKANAKQMLSKDKAKLSNKEERRGDDNKINIKEINKEKFNFKKSLIELGISENIVSDWLKVRAKKKAANTETAFKGIKREIEKSCISPNECIKIAVERNWQGFKAEWLENLKPDTKPQQNFNW